MIKSYFDITLTLAGICQIVRLVQQVAHQSQYEEQSLRVALQTLFDLKIQRQCGRFMEIARVT